MRAQFCQAVRALGVGGVASNRNDQNGRTVRFLNNCAHLAPAGHSRARKNAGEAAVP
jgi:hypothetical protein